MAENTKIEQATPDRPLSRSQLCRRRRLSRELGIPVDQLPDRRGRHGNHAKGKDHPKWNTEARMISEHGYVKLRVGKDHPLADICGYAYEHSIVWAAAGRPAPMSSESIHHKDEDKTNNRIENLELKTRSDHAAHHDAIRGRDAEGRFMPGPEFPKARV